MKKILILLILILSLSAISCVSAYDDNLDDVTTSDLNELSISLEDDEALGANHYVNSQDDIQTIVDNANDGDTVVLNGTFELNSAVTVSKSIKIVGDGDGATVKLSDFCIDKPRFFIINSSASNVVLSNIKFISGITNQNGGAILWQADNGLISKCEFNANNADGGSGGAVMITANNCNVSECLFVKNYANKNAGAICIEGNNNHITDCKFNENYAYDSGGAVSVSGEDNEISDCIFTGNYVNAGNTESSGGGAIYSGGQGLTINNCTFNGNSARESSGGAVRMGKYDKVQNSTFEKNRALLGNNIYADSTGILMSNHFIVDENETKEDSIYGSGFMDVNNVYHVNKIDSKVTFSTGMIFEYDSTGTIYMRVIGGSVKTENIQVLGHPEAKIVFSNNLLSVSNLPVGKYTLRVTTTPDDYHYSVNEDLTITVNKATAVVKAEKITVAYKKSSKWTIKIVNSKNNKPIANMKLNLKVYTGKKYKTVTVTTNSKGEASYQTNKLSKGTHKIVVSATHNSYNFNTASSSITVVKQKPLKFKVDQNIARDGTTLSITVKNKKTNKAVKGVQINVLIYSGKKVVYKVTLKTKKKGICGYTTNKLSVGKHKVKLVPTSIVYSGSKITSMKITKKQKAFLPWESLISAK